jgi:hypothetical protein
MYANQQPYGARNVQYLMNGELGLLILRQHVMPRPRCSVRSGRSCGSEVLPEIAEVGGYALGLARLAQSKKGSSEGGRSDHSK